MLPVLCTGSTTLLFKIPPKQNAQDINKDKMDLVETVGEVAVLTEDASALQC
jgi:hypothetical protein